MRAVIFDLDGTIEKIPKKWLKTDGSYQNRVSYSPLLKRSYQLHNGTKRSTK